jgi:hypothetical protein
VTSVIPPSLQSALRALASSFIPETAAASDTEWAALEVGVERALAARPAAMRRQLGLFVHLLSAAARVRYRTALVSLDPTRRTALLEWFARSPVLRFRRGIWGLRTLIMLGWYTQPSVIDALGYRADPAGWDAIR